MEAKIKNMLERSAIEIAISLAIKILIILCYLQALQSHMPMEIFSINSVFLALTAILLWFFELDGGFVSSLIISNIISTRRRAKSISSKNNKVIESLNI